MLVFFKMLVADWLNVHVNHISSFLLPGTNYINVGLTFLIDSDEAVTVHVCSRLYFMC